MGLLDSIFGDDGSKQKKRAARKAAKDKQDEKKAKEEEEERIKKEDKQKKREFNQSVGKSYKLAQGDVEDYFGNRGITDLSQYAPQIERALQEAKSSIPDLAGNVNSYFSGVPESVYNSIQDAMRTRAQTDLSKLYQPGFSSDLIGDTADDDVIANILSTQRAQADKYAKNLLDRGVVTNSGYGAIMDDLLAQEGKARGTLNDLGSGILSGERSKLEDIFNQGMFNAGNLNLGQTFNAGDYGKKIDDEFSSFLSSLGDKFNAQVPSNLFQTSGLAARGGAAQGAQNTAFDPKALAGIFDEDDQDDEDRKDTSF